MLVKLENVRNASNDDFMEVTKEQIEYAEALAIAMSIQVYEIEV